MSSLEKSEKASYGEWIEKRKCAGLSTCRYFVQNANAKTEERFGKVDDLLTPEVNRKRRYCYVSFLYKHMIDSRKHTSTFSSSLSVEKYQTLSISSLTIPFQDPRIALYDYKY